MSASAVIVEVDGGPATSAGQDRRRAVVLAFAMCLAVGSSTVGRDGPAATAPVEAPHTLILSRDTTDAVLFGFPDRLANEPLPNLPYVTVVVRGTEGLAVHTAETDVRDEIKWIEFDPQESSVQGWLVTWTEGGTSYSLTSAHRKLSDLLRVAGSLR